MDLEMVGMQMFVLQSQPEASLNPRHQPHVDSTSHVS